MPRLERPSVVVMDNAPYQHTKTDESFYPKQRNKKAEIIQWLRGKNVETKEFMKKVLFIFSLKFNQKSYNPKLKSKLLQTLSPYRKIIKES